MKKVVHGVSTRVPNPRIHRRFVGFRKIDMYGEVWPPFSVKIELVHGCPHTCGYCWSNQSTSLKFMHPEHLKIILENIDRLQWECRVEFTGDGDPSLHPALSNIVNLYSRKISRQSANINVHTTCVGWKDEYISRTIDLFRHGATSIWISNYRQNAKSWNGFGEGAVAFLERKIPDLKIHMFNRYNTRFRWDEKHLILCPSPVKRKTVHNWGANIFKPNDSRSTMPCALPYREMMIRYDGTITICECDSNHEAVMGHVTEGLRAVWEGEVFRGARARLKGGDRSVRPCTGCDIGKTYGFGKIGLNRYTKPPTP